MLKKKQTNKTHNPTNNPSTHKIPIFPQAQFYEIALLLCAFQQAKVKWFNQKLIPIS